jgi:hypothetical protein
MRRLLLASLLTAAACDFPHPSEEYACRANADCETGRICTAGYCVLGQENKVPDASNTLPKDAPAIDAMIDADPFVMIAQQCIAAGYTMDASGLHRAVPTSATWVNAESDCANDVAGATHLVVLSSTAEVTYVKTQLGWVGLSDRATEGTFVNVTGEPGDLRPWESDQPDNGGGNENCAQMKAAGLDDDQCGNGHRYVCECDGRMPLP